MRGFQEVHGHNIRLVYDRERADFVTMVEPHVFLVRKPRWKSSPGLTAATARCPRGGISVE